MGLNINGAVAGKVAKVLSMIDLPWPGGDPDALRRLAREWRSLAGRLTTTAEHLDGAVHGVVGSSWEGSAADSFAAHWAAQHQALLDSAKNFQAVAKELDAYADEAEQIIAAIVDIALQIAEFELAGALLTVFTAGISDAVSAAASGERALKIVQLLDRFIEMAQKAERVITELVEDIRKLGVVPRILVDGLKNTSMNLLGTQLSNLMSGKGLIGAKDAETAGLAGFGAAGLGSALEGVGGALTSKGAHAAPPSRIVQLLSGDGLSSGMNTVRTIGMGAVTSAAGGALADGVEGNGLRATVVDTVTDGLTGGVGAGLAGSVKSTTNSTGKHAAPNPLTPVTVEIGGNGAVYGAGGALEGALNNNPTLPEQNQGLDGAVEVPQ
ncbi:WXG100 family type VII secretion target [Streptacidiphilus sp. PAMC 29251]